MPSLVFVTSRELERAGSITQEAGQPVNRASPLSTLAQRTLPFLKLAIEYSAAHFATRLVAAMSALLLVRILPVTEYGYYSLLLSAFTFICTFSDLGSTETLAYFRWRARGRSWQPYYEAVLRFRTVVFGIGFVLAGGYLWFTGGSVSWPVGNIVLGLAIVGSGAWLAIQSSVRTYALKLKQRLRPVYVVEVGGELAKLAAVSLIWLSGLATAVVAGFSLVFGALVAALLSLRFVEKKVGPSKRTTKKWGGHFNRALLGQILPILPGTVQYALQGLLVSWLAAYYGSAVHVAEVGALGRLGVIIGVIAGLIGNLIVPGLAAIHDRDQFSARYFLWWCPIALSGGVILIVVWAFPKALLLLLGDAYSGLHGELLVAAATAVASTWGAYAWHINRVRGWVTWQPFRVPVILVGQLVMFVALDFSSTFGVLLFGLGTVLLDVIFQTLLNGIGFYLETRAVSTDSVKRQVKGA